MSSTPGRTTEFFKGRDAALRRPDGAARRPYRENEPFCPAPSTPTVAEPVLCDGWHLHEVSLTGSTNLAAAHLSPWEAVRADRQTAGRGRFQRGWISDEGGLWLSAVVPTGPNAADARALPLVAGLAVCDALRSVGLTQLRLRWPNDVLVHDRKLAGLLIDQFAPGRAVAGIGINVFNQPERHDPALKNQTTRLADLMDAPPELPRLTRAVLSSLRLVLGEFHAGGFASLLPRVNRLWDGPRPVELDLDGPLCRGTFAGVNEEGQLVLRHGPGHPVAYHAHQVRHLKEIDSL